MSEYDGPGDHRVGPVEGKIGWRSWEVYDGWAMLLISALSMTIGYGVLSSFGVLYLDILKEFGASRARTAGIIAANSILYGISTPLVGQVQDRWGPRKVLVSGALLVALATFAAGFVRSLWHLYLLYSLLSFGIAALGFVPNTALLSRLFPLGRGRAMGLAFAGGTIGASCMVPLTGYLASTFGWRMAYQTIGGLILILVPLIAFSLRKKPHMRDFLLDRGVIRKALILDKRWASQTWTFSCAARTHQFWSIAAGHLFLGLFMSILRVHQVAHIVGKGYGELLAASIFALSGILRAPGSLIGGLICDRLGREADIMVSAGLIISSILSLLAVTDISRIWMLYLFALLFGLGGGVGTPGQGASIADLFEGKGLGSILGFLEMPAGIGGGIGAWLAGYLFDRTGSYETAFILAIFAIPFYCMGYWFAAPRKIRRRRRGASMRSPGP